MSEVPKPIPKELKELDRQFTEYLDDKIVNHLLDNTGKSRKEAIKTTAVRVFSHDADTVAPALHKYQDEARKRRQA